MEDPCIDLGALASAIVFSVQGSDPESTPASTTYYDPLPTLFVGNDRAMLPAASRVPNQTKVPPSIPDMPLTHERRLTEQRSGVLGVPTRRCCRAYDDVLNAQRIECEEAPMQPCMPH
jgi:hypothetical protein